MAERDSSTADAALDDVEQQSSGTKPGASRPSMERDQTAQCEWTASHGTFGQKVRRVATAPVRTWRKLLGLLALP